MCASWRPPPWEQQPSKVLAPRVPTDDVHGSHGRQVCRRHELYVSFQDLGWLVSADSPPFPNVCPHLETPSAFQGRQTHGELGLSLFSSISKFSKGRMCCFDSEKCCFVKP